tara:strand:- start:25 stop:222 length:198 start_codon:yes stop_codon:yes gene_type:complete
MVSGIFEYIELGIGINIDVSDLYLLYSASFPYFKFAEASNKFIPLINKRRMVIQTKPIIVHRATP